MDESKRSAKSLARIVELFEQELVRAGSAVRQLDEQQLKMQQQRFQLQAFFSSYSGFEIGASASQAESSSKIPSYAAQLLCNRHHFIQRLDQALDDIDVRLEENQQALLGARDNVHDVARQKQGVELLAEKSKSKLQKRQELREVAEADEVAAQYHYRRSRD